MSKFFNNANNNDIDFGGHNVDFGNANLDFTGANIEGTVDFQNSIVEGVYGFTPYDQPPAVPDAVDDEFTGATLDPKWTLFGSPAPTFVQRLYNTWAEIDAPYPPGTNYKGIYQPLPSGNGSYVTKLALDKNTYIGDGWVGIGLFNNLGTGAMLQYGASGATILQVADRNIVTYNYGTNIGTDNSVGYLPYVWLRIDWNSSASRYTPYWSTNGFTWIQKQTVDFVNPGTPTRIFLAYGNNGAATTPVSLFIDYFRKVA